MAPVPVAIPPMKPPAVRLASQGDKVSSSVANTGALPRTTAEVYASMADVAASREDLPAVPLSAVNAEHPSEERDARAGGPARALRPEMPESTSPVMPEMLAGVCDVNARTHNVHNEHGRRVFIAGIAGPSGVGKSSLARNLAQTLNSPVKPIALDAFFLTGKQRKQTQTQRGCFSWESPQGVDFSLLRNKIFTVCDAVRKDKKNGCSNSEINVVIVEGFLLFYDAAICQMLDACIWLETDMTRCAIRRSARSKKKSKAGFTRFQQWYELEVWASFQQYRTVQLTNARYALKIDGALDLATISRQAAEHIEHSVEAARSADERRKHSRRGTAAPIGDAAAQRALLSAPTPPTARPEKKRRTVPSRKQADRSPRRRAGRFSHTSSPPTRWKSGAASADCRIQRSAARPHGDLAPSDGTRAADPRGLRRRPPADADTATDPTEGIPAWRAEADARRAAADAPYWDWVAAQRLTGKDVGHG